MNDWKSCFQQSQGSYLTEGNQLIAPSIGLTANRSTLSCRLNLQEQQYKYCKGEKQSLQALKILDFKLKRWAFRQIQKITHYHKEVSRSIFVPQALSKGDYSVVSQFLGILKNNRINSYIKLNLEESYGYFHKAATLLKPTAKIVKKKMKYAFDKLRSQSHEKQSDNKILMDIDRYSSIQKPSSEYSFDFSCQNVVNISYVGVKIKSQQNKNSHQQKEIKKDSTVRRTQYNNYIDLNQLIRGKKIKQYQFQQCNSPQKIIHQQHI